MGDGKETKGKKKGAPKAKVEPIHIVRIEEASDSSRVNFITGAGRVIFAVRGPDPGLPIKRDAVHRAISKLEEGQKPGEIIGTNGARRGHRRNVRSPAVVAAIKGDALRDPYTLTNSHRALAARPRVSQGAIYRVL